MVRRSADCWRKQYPFNSILAQRLQEVQLTLHRLSAVSQNKHSSEIFQRLLQARSDVGKVGVDQVANRHADDPGPLVAKVTCEIGRAHVTPVTNAHLVCRLLLEKKNEITYHQPQTPDNTAS